MKPAIEIKPGDTVRVLELRNESYNGMWAGVGSTFVVKEIFTSATAGYYIVHRQGGSLGEFGIVARLEKVPAVAPVPPAATPEDGWTFRDFPNRVDLPRVLREASEARFTYFVLTVGGDTPAKEPQNKREYLFVRRGSADADVFRTDELLPVGKMVLETNPGASKVGVTFMPNSPFGPNGDWCIAASYVDVDKYVARIKQHRACRGKVRVIVRGEKAA